MGPSRIYIYLLGIFVVAAAENFSNDVQNIGVGSNERDDLERQFNTDWNDLEDPLDWMNNVIEVDFDDIPRKIETERSYAKIYEENVAAGTILPDEETKTFPGVSFSTSEEFESNEESDDGNMYEDSSEESSEDHFIEKSKNHKTMTGEQSGGQRKRDPQKRKSNNRKIFKKMWPKRRGQEKRINRRFRNPHGSERQVPHPPPTGRWQRVWQRLNNSKPAQAGRWAAMYSRTQGYWNRVRDRLAKRVLIGKKNDRQSDSNEDSNVAPDVRTDNYTYHGHQYHTFNNKSHHLHQRNHSHHNHTHHSHPRNHTHRQHTHHHMGSPRPRRRWLEDKVAHVCNYLSSSRHRRYMRFVTDKQGRLGSTERRDYRLQFAEQMSHCCQKDYEEKLECFGNLTRARIDEFCRSNSNMPFRPWKSGQNPRAVRKIKPKCCLPDGEARYNCFNRTHQGYRLNEPEVVLEKEEKNQEITIGASQHHSRRYQRRQMKRQHKWTPRQEVKTRCCSLGRTHGSKLRDRDNVTVECNKLARKLSQKSKNKLICHMALGRCCINEARKQTHSEMKSSLDPKLEQELDAIEEMSSIEDLEISRSERIPHAGSNWLYL